MQVGLGITTFNRPECLKECLESISKHTNVKDFSIYIADDSKDLKGVAVKKNECLRALKDCDHIFLFDDDCFPIKDGWADYFIDSGMNHLLFLNRTHKPIPSILKNATKYVNCGGVFMYLTKDVLNKVGAFNENFERWGFEHAEYSQRICMAGLIPYPYISLNNTKLYLYAKDYSEPAHKSSITNEDKEYYFKKNIHVFMKPIENIFIPL